MSSFPTNLALRSVLLKPTHFPPSPPPPPPSTPIHDRTVAVSPPTTVNISSPHLILLFVLCLNHWGIGLFWDAFLAKNLFTLNDLCAACIEWRDSVIIKKTKEPSELFRKSETGWQYVSQLTILVDFSCTLNDLHLQNKPRGRRRSNGRRKNFAFNLNERAAFWRSPSRSRVQYCKLDYITSEMKQKVLLLFVCSLIFHFCTCLDDDYVG